MNIESKVKLNNGVEMPRFGLGVFRTKEGSEVENAVKTALEAGYRSIDTASIYHNEIGVGKAIRESGIKRDKIFVTTKLWNSDQGYKQTKKAYDDSLNRLQLNYVDLYLIHWPKGEISIETWKAMEELHKEKKVRAIGVSNFLIHHLEEFLPHCKTVPVVNQVEFHPELTQPELFSFCLERNIQLEAWSPIMKGNVNNIPVLQALAAKYGKTPVQVTLRWEIQNGVITIPKSSKTERIISNADIFDFEIAEEDLNKIDRLNRNNRIGPHPDKIPF